MSNSAHIAIMLHSTLTNLNQLANTRNILVVMLGDFKHISAVSFLANHRKIPNQGEMQSLM
jgi:hypothetical protein